MKSEIIHGDARAVLGTLEDSTIHLTITSPPYYNARPYSHWESYEEYLKFLEEVFTEVYRVTKQGRMCVVNLSPVIVPREKRSCESTRLPIPFDFFPIMQKMGWKYLDDIIWSKPEGSAANRNGKFFQHRKPVAYKPNVVTEVIFVFQKPAPFLIDKVLKSYDKEIISRSLVTSPYERSNLWKINPVTKSKHPAVFPKALSDKIITYYSFVGDKVLDPFLGSGTTLLSCKVLAREGIGCDIHKEYCELAKNRLAHLSTEWVK